ncbi:MAG TPA: SANT/Myb-like DNA-binding domain-containing protein [Candidatus Cybelea sp.]|nr:SANT/Myb-like DNA-binding domain-containing protein [Candidatus Cybelea sp.]
MMPVRWTEARLKRVQDLHAAGTPWHVIAAEMAATVDNCKVNLTKFRKKQGIARKQAPPWSAEEDSTLIQARQIDRKPWKEVAAIVGRPEGACIARRDILSARDKAIEGPRRHNRGKGQTPPAVITIDDKAAAASLAYARARAARDLTASLMGDPPPGYSALDRKRGGAIP